MNNIVLMAPCISVLCQFNKDNIRILVNPNNKIILISNFHEPISYPLEKIQNFKTWVDSLGIICYDLPFVRNSLFRNHHLIKKYRQILRKEQINFIHCQTDFGGYLTRLAIYGVHPIKILYTPHGLPIGKNLPIINWIKYYLFEKYLCSRFSSIIVMNKSEESIAYKLLKKVYYVPGIGIDLLKFDTQLIDTTKTDIRKELNIPQDAFIIITVAELIQRKNYQLCLKIIAKLKNHKVHYLICGVGNCRNQLEILSKKLGISQRVHFLGFRSDIPHLLRQSNLFLLLSKNEGLPVSVMEAMATGLPVIGSLIPGVEDLIDDHLGGYLYKLNSIQIDSICSRIEDIVNNISLLNNFFVYNITKIKSFDSQIIHLEMEKIYKSYNLI